MHEQPFGYPLAATAMLLVLACHCSGPTADPDDSTLDSIRHPRRGDAGVDSGTADSGAFDAATSDSATPDSATPDAGSDGGASDAGAPDSTPGTVPDGGSGNTFYIDATSGQDSNDGRSKTTPWKHHPYMQGFSGSYSHVAGDHFIFKGGVTWDHTNFGMEIAAGGTSASPDYYGVDLTWYTGTSWQRPAFSGDHAHLASGANIIDIGNQSYIVVDGIEVRAHTAFSNWGNGSIGLYCSDHIIMENLWVHDWALDASVTSDDAHGGIIGNYPSCYSTGTWVDHSEISNSEGATAGRQNGIATRAVNVRFSTINDVGSAMLFGVPHDTEIYNVAYPSKNVGFDTSYHSNVTYLTAWDGGVPATTSGYVYNNYIHDVTSGSGALYVNPSCDSIYIFNNVVAHSHWNGDVLIDPYWSRAGCGEVYLFNNTFQLDATDATPFTPIRLVDRGFAFNLLSIQNNHFIHERSWYVDKGPGVANLTDDHNLEMTNAAATAAGYVSGNLYAPSASTAPTVGVGINLTGLSLPLLDTDRRGSQRPQTGSWDVGAYQYR